MCIRDSDTSFNTDVSSAFNSTDFGLALGIGVKIPVSDKIKIFIEFDGQGGSTNIIKNNPYSDVTTSRSSLNFGMNFMLK
jgi:opacity protein-like surface antigen